MITDPLLELAEVPESGLSPGLDALPMTVEALRSSAADHLHEHRLELEPFLTMESSGAIFARFSFAFPLLSAHFLPAFCSLFGYLTRRSGRRPELR